MIHRVTAMQRVSGCLIAVMGALLVGCSSPPPLGAPEQTSAVGGVDFSGAWEMDYRLSEQADQKIRWRYLEALAEEKRARESEAGRFRNQRGPVIGLNEQKPRRLAEGILAIGQLAEKISRSSVFNVRQTDEQIVIERVDDFSLICDFQEQATPVSNLGQERCYWYGQQLVFDIGLPESLNVRHVLTLAEDRNRLNVATTLFHPQAGAPFTLNRVYMPFDPEPGMYDCEFKLTTLKTCRMGSSEK